MEPILSISEIFNSYLKDDEYMVIPSYQRGYEWDEDDIRILLDDIAKFATAGLDNDKFYCLQHITLIKKKDKDGHTFYNIVDGQQRITTLAIILSFYGKGQMFGDKLRYEVRTETGKFLKDYIFTRKYWRGNYSEKPRHKDEYYIVQAADIVRKWESETPKQKDFSLEDFIDALLAKVKIIVNDVSGNEETVFANINGVKAELDGADLLRAVQITRSAEEKYETSDSDTHKENKENKVNEYRVKMGMELDSINLWCNFPEVRKYLELFLPENAFEKSGFFVKDHPIDYLYRMMYEIHSDKTAKFEFRFFEYGLNKNSKNNDDNWEMYEELKNIYSSLYDWYGDNEIYHYTAYLFSQHKQSLNFKTIYEKWDNLGSKQEFARYLKNMIVEMLLRRFNDEDNGSGNSQSDAHVQESKTDLLKEISDIQHNWYGDPMSSTILILSDVILCTRKNSLNRLPIDRFRRNSEDIEHIGCRTPNEEDCADTIKWRAYIEEIEKSGIDIEKDTIKRWKASLESSSDTQKQIDKIVSELNAYGLNSLGNLVLLDQSVNRSYRNASFHKKKMIILSHYFGNTEEIKGKSEKNIKPIRPYTLKVFSSEEDNKWTLEDIKRTAEALSGTIKKFIA